MSEAAYPINVPGHPTEGIPQIDAEFGRATVLIGANGSGKSRLLKTMVGMGQSFGPTVRPVTYIEGGRVIQIPQELSDPMGQSFLTLERAQDTVKLSKSKTAAGRLRGVLLLLDRRAVEVGVRHSEAVTQWQNGGFQGECPIVEKNPLKELFEMFSEVFPEIKVTFNLNTKQLSCEKNGSTYSPTDLSDGERQAFFILADIALTTPADSLIIVDEPELNLNPLLADRLWNTIEDKLTDAVFCIRYTQHQFCDAA